VIAPVRIVHIRIETNATTSAARTPPNRVPVETSTPFRSSSSASPSRIHSSPRTTCTNESGMTIAATITIKFCQWRA
jgi:hypothetical protein